MQLGPPHSSYVVGVTTGDNVEEFPEHEYKQALWPLELCCTAMVCAASNRYCRSRSDL